MIEPLHTTVCPAWRGDCDADTRPLAWGQTPAWAGGLHRPDPSPNVPRLHRRLLERFAACPFQGWAVETGRVEAASARAEAGRQVHRVIARAIRAYVEEGADPVRRMARRIASARPDVQTDAIAGLRPSLQAIGRFLESLPAGAILAHRGGRGPRSGLLARGLPGRRGVRIVSTADLLHAGASGREIHEIDFRSGQKVLTATDVRASLKYRVHAWCLFGAAAGLAAHHVRVWHTRTNALTPPVTFGPEDAGMAAAAIAAAVRARCDILAALGDAPDPDAPARLHADRPGDFWWPDPAKCAACPACTICPAARSPARDLAGDPEGFLRDTAALQATLDQRIALLRGTVRRTGRDLVFPGIAFGVCKPRPAVNPVAGVYRPVEAAGD